MANYYPQATHTTTDAQLIALWLRGKRRATQTSYATVIRQFQSFIGDKGLTEVVREDILLWLGSLELRGFTANTINQRLAAIRSLFARQCRPGRENSTAVRCPARTDSRTRGGEKADWGGP